MWSGKKPLPEAMLTKFYNSLASLGFITDIIWEIICDEDQFSMADLSLISGVLVWEPVKRVKYWDDKINFLSSSKGYLIDTFKKANKWSKIH